MPRFQPYQIVQLYPSFNAQFQWASKYIFFLQVAKVMLLLPFFSDQVEYCSLDGLKCLTDNFGMAFEEKLTDFLHQIILFRYTEPTSC